MVFARWRGDEPLQPNALGIAEPMPSALAFSVAKLDIMFLPLLGWDKHGGRLGMGAGYYDRALAGVDGPTLIGLAHQVQEVDKLPIDTWDIPLNSVVTDKNIYHRQQ
jgi:5-formyltetrahydrofolate cyclo-ligase